MGTQRAFINTEHLEFERWGPPLVEVDWHAFCQVIYRGIEGKEWEELCYHCRELSKATGATDSILPTPPGPTPLWGPRSIPDNWADVCGFFKLPGSQQCWKVDKHGAFSIPRKSLGLRPTDQSCHHETWLHLDFVDWSRTTNQRDHSFSS